MNNCQDWLILYYLPRCRQHFGEIRSMKDYTVAFAFARRKRPAVPCRSYPFKRLNCEKSLDCWTFGPGKEKINCIAGWAKLSFLFCSTANPSKSRVEMCPTFLFLVSTRADGQMNPARIHCRCFKAAAKQNPAG